VSAWSSTSSTRTPDSAPRLVPAGASRGRRVVATGDGGRLGSRNVKVAPRPRPGLSALTVPPCSSARMARDGQAEPEPAVPTRDRTVGLAEAVEDVLEQLGLDADAGVAHPDHGVAVVPCQAHAHAGRRPR
jgi:hypothetical protein